MGNQHSTKSTAMAVSSSDGLPAVSDLPPPIVYTIAGSDSGGGAGIQADLHAIHSMGCHGCSAVTCLTAQSSTGVTGVHSPPADFLRLQLDTLTKDLPPRAIKIGMLGSKELAVEVSKYLKDLLDDLKKKDDDSELPFIVFDPVMISTSGHKLIQDEAKEAMISNVFPLVDIITPNKFEAEELLGRKLNSPQDVEQAAKDILKMGCKSVLIKGGHSLLESNGKSYSGSEETVEKLDLNATIGFAQDYFLSSEPPLDKDGKERLCDGCRGVWLRSKRYDTENTHGTGCTLSSAIASALAIGHQQRSSQSSGTGAARSIYVIDACVLGKAYVTAGISRSSQLGQGPGPVTHTQFPSTSRHFPFVTLDPLTSSPNGFLKMKSSDDTSSNNGEVTLGKILPIVDNVEWLERLTKTKKVKDIQLRIKGETDEDKIFALVEECQKICKRDGVRLWINDFWKAAVKAGCFGVHVGQEDLATCADQGGLEEIKKHGLALGISTHSYAELSLALGLQPSYISLGPVFGTTSKNVAFDPQGVETIRKWKQLINQDIPLVVIGGINDAERTKEVKAAGADCVAVIGAVKKEDAMAAVTELENAMISKEVKHI